MSVPKLRFKEFTPEYNEYELKTLLKSYRLGGNYSNSESKTNYPLIKMGNLNRGSINLSKIEYISSDEIIDDQDQIQLGDLFFNTRNTLDLVGKVAIWRNELPVAYYNSNLMRLEFENNFYMNFLLNTEKSLEKLKAIASGTTSVAAIYTKDLLKVKVKIPFVDEQTKIASFLCAVDEKISQLTQKHELLSQYKQGMMRKLFSQQIRFKADDGSEFGEWEETELGKHCQIKTGKLDANAMRPNGEFRFYTCAKEFYLIDEYAFDTEALLISGNGANVGYIHYYKGKFNAYQRTYVLDQWQQNIIFIQYFLEQFLKERIYGEKKEGNTPYIVLSTLSEMPLLLPCLEEQTKIAKFLSAIDQKIEVVAQQIEQAKQWKKGLLQQMFI